MRSPVSGRTRIPYTVILYAHNTFTRLARPSQGPPLAGRSRTVSRVKYQRNRPNANLRVPVMCVCRVHSCRVKKVNAVSTSIQTRKRAGTTAARRGELKPLPRAPPSFDYRTVTSWTVEVRGASRAAGRRARRRRAPRRSRSHGGPAAFGLGVGLGLGLGLGPGLG